MRTYDGFDVIFCCNVPIYFDTIAKQQVVADLYDALNKTGYLFWLSGIPCMVSKAFKLCSFSEDHCIQKRIGWKLLYAQILCR